MGVYKYRSFLEKSHIGSIPAIFALKLKESRSVHLILKYCPSHNILAFTHITISYNYLLNGKIILLLIAFSEYHVTY